MTDKYYIKEGSDSGHCCFEYTVIDSSKCVQVCECFDIKQAQLICNALNKGENK